MSRHLLIIHSSRLSTRKKDMLDETTKMVRPDFFQYLLDLEVKKAVRYLYFFSLAIVQTDQPIEGTDTETSLLPIIADLIREEVRETDVIGKVDRDKFFIILDQADFHAAQGVGDRIRERIEQYSFQVNQQKVPLTVSMGTACFPSHANELSPLIQRAQDALTHAKEMGGNRVCLPEQELNTMGDGMA